MIMELKDVIHFYLGCECEASGETGLFTAITTTGQCGVGFGYNHKVIKLFTVAEIKPILRPLSDMTDEEMKECGNLVYDFSDEPDLNNWQWKDFQIIAPEQFQWLLSRGFDLFDLISSGQAIDKTKK